MKNKTAYIRLTAPITPLSTQRLLQIIDEKYRQKVQKLHLLLSTPGGNVTQGISLYNFLKGLDMEVITHNFGTVDSIGVILYCAGEKRYSVPNARFLLHPVAMRIPQGNVDENWLLESTKSLEIDQANIARIIAHTVSSKEENILQDMRDRKTLRPTEAKEYGLVNKIDAELLPVDADFTPIHESDAFPSQAVPMPAMQIAAPTPTFSPTPPSASSDIYDRGIPCT